MGRLRILVAGAGPAGNTVAYWLSKLGHEVTIVERWPTLRDSGLQVDLRGHGIEVMKRMGIEEAFRTNAASEIGIQFVDKFGKRWAYFPAKKDPSGMGSQSFTSDYEIMRGVLCRIMFDVTKDRVNYVFGTSIESFGEKDEDGLEVRFTDGKVETFDLLIGADGQGSHTRKMMLGPNVPDAFNPLNECTAYFTITRPIKPEEEYIATTYTATGSRFILTRRADAHKMQVYMTGDAVSERMKNVRKGDVEGEKQALTEVFRGAGWQAEEILELMKDSDNFYCERQGLVKLDPWFQGRVVLVGDAAYCPTSSAGMGTSSALIGGYVLAGEIGRHCGKANDDLGGVVVAKEDLTKALKSYDDTLRPFMNEVQRGVGESSFLDKVPWTSFTIATLNWVLRIVAKLKIDPFAFQSRENSGWKLPEYQEFVGN